MQLLRAGVSLLLLLPVASAATAADGGSVKIEGDFTADIETPSAEFIYNERAKAWFLQLRSPREYREEHGSGFTITFFFSNDFTPAAGDFPVRFSYRAKPDTLGGSVIVSGEERVMLSHDTEGSITFDRFDDRVEGSFRFVTFDGSDDPRRSVEAHGTFSCERGEALP